MLVKESAAVANALIVKPTAKLIEVRPEFNAAIANSDHDSGIEEMLFSGEAVERFPEGTFLTEILVKFGVFPSRGQAKKNGWDRLIVPGLNEFQIGKLKTKVTVWLPIKFNETEEISLKESIFAKIDNASTELDLIQIAIKDSPYIYYLPKDETKAIMAHFCSKAKLAAQIWFFNNCPTTHADLVLGTPELNESIKEFNFGNLFRSTVKKYSNHYISAGHRELDTFIMILSPNELTQVASDLRSMYEAYLPRHNNDESKGAISCEEFSASLPSLKKDLIASFDFAKSKNPELQKYDHLISR